MRRLQRFVNVLVTMVLAALAGAPTGTTRNEYIAISPSLKPAMPLRLPRTCTGGSKEQASLEGADSLTVEWTSGVANGKVLLKQR